MLSALEQENDAGLTRKILHAAYPGFEEWVDSFLRSQIPEELHKIILVSAIDPLVKNEVDPLTHDVGFSEVVKFLLDFACEPDRQLERLRVRTALRRLNTCRHRQEILDFKLCLYFGQASPILTYRDMMETLYLTGWALEHVAKT